MRSFLTMLGIIIGVAVVIILVSLVNGYMGSVCGELRQHGCEPDQCKCDQSGFLFPGCGPDVGAFYE